jgi:hypothetical protein
MKTTKKKKAEKVVGYRAVLWECPNCMTLSLHPTDEHAFDCIHCGTILFAEGPKSATFEGDE